MHSKGNGISLEGGRGGGLLYLTKINTREQTVPNDGKINALGERWGDILK